MVGWQENYGKANSVKIRTKTKVNGHRIMKMGNESTQKTNKDAQGVVENRVWSQNAQRWCIEKPSADSKVMFGYMSKDQSRSEAD